MLTGDNGVTARVIAKEVGIDVVRTDLKPEEKINAMWQWVKVVDGSNFTESQVIGDFA